MTTKNLHEIKPGDWEGHLNLQSRLIIRSTVKVSNKNVLIPGAKRGGAPSYMKIKTGNNVFPAMQAQHGRAMTNARCFIASLICLKCFSMMCELPLSVTFGIIFLIHGEKSNVPQIVFA
ncbi:hypothetical protein CDAR_250531 [Caerostris darwini]|uniref:Uncharacterized protein n=1 Tax=Caerostris darwini TaxID=1538125 RepID=A0AAV4UEL1_9ARAC|nr:hypothetical protein CDAR_250531 [Caerostris darwini]